MKKLLIFPVPSILAGIASLIRPDIDLLHLMFISGFPLTVFLITAARDDLRSFWEGGRLLQLLIFVGGFLLSTYFVGFIHIGFAMGFCEIGIFEQGCVARGYGGSLDD